MLKKFKMNKPTSKIFTFLTITLILISFTSTISAHEIVWTEHSDTTSISFVVEHPAEQPQEPEQPCDNDAFIDEIEHDRGYEQAIMETKYGKWTCINNQLQRMNIVNGKQVVEYDGICGIEYNDKAVKQKTILDTLILLPFTLFILILILSVFIVLTLLRR